MGGYPVYGVGQGGGQDYFRGAGGKEVLRGSRGQERRKSATRGTGSPTWECSLGLVGGGGDGSWVTVSGSGRLWPWGPFSCFAPGPSGPCFPIDLAPTKTGNIPREKEGTRWASADLGESRIIRETRTPYATKSGPENLQNE